jgi:hypothetical protein
MRLSKKVLLVWLGGVALFALGLLVLPHKDATFASFMIVLLQLLLLIITINIVRKEPTQKNKYLFINFAAFFSLAIPTYLYNFVGTVFFTGEPFARLYANQYLFFGLFYFMLAIAVVYLTIDVLFRDYRTFQKYLVTFAIVGAFFGYYYHGYFIDPKFTHHTPDVQDWKALSTTWGDLVKENGVTPTEEELASITPLNSWKDGKAVGVLFPDERLARVQMLYPYLPDNYTVLVYKPIFLNVIYMCVVCIGFILLFFGYMYMKDPPQGAYIEKIMFLFLVFCSLEILHSWTTIKTIEWKAADAIWNVGQYVSTVVLAMIAGAFGMRLRFITSVKGEFYEQELALSPKGVTRWRDSIDNIVIEKFFNRKLLLGRMFVTSSPTRERHQ